MTPVQEIAYTREVLSRVRPSVPSEPASFIARALHRRLPDRIRGAGTLYLWLRRGRTALRVARRLSANGREHEFIDACARIYDMKPVAPQRWERGEWEAPVHPDA